MEAKSIVAEIGPAATIAAAALDEAALYIAVKDGSLEVVGCDGASASARTVLDGAFPDAKDFEARVAPDKFRKVVAAAPSGEVSLRLTGKRVAVKCGRYNASVPVVTHEPAVSAIELAGSSEVDGSTLGAALAVAALPIDPGAPMPPPMVSHVGGVAYGAQSAWIAAVGTGLGLDFSLSRDHAVHLSKWLNDGPCSVSTATNGRWLRVRQGHVEVDYLMPNADKCPDYAALVEANAGQTGAAIIPTTESSQSLSRMWRVLEQDPAIGFTFGEGRCRLSMVPGMNAHAEAEDAFGCEVFSEKSVLLNGGYVLRSVQTMKVADKVTVSFSEHGLCLLEAEELCVRHLIAPIRR